MLSSQVLKNVQKSGKQILIVTKYFPEDISKNILSTLLGEHSNIFYGLGENRTDSLKEKKLPREHTHFIGNIQSRQIADIVHHSSIIHSLGKISHAEKIENLGQTVQAFIQIQLDAEKNIGVSPEELPLFLDKCKDMKYLNIIGISGMGKSEASESERRAEFQLLLDLRDTYFPEGKISAGTSRDYEIALEMGIDIVRVGQKVIEL